MAPHSTTSKKAKVNAGMTDNVQSGTVRRRKWLESLSQEKLDELRRKDRERKKLERARHRELRNGQATVTATPPQGDPSTDVEMAGDGHEDEDEEPALVPPRTSQYRVSRLVRFESEESDVESAEPAFAPAPTAHSKPSKDIRMDSTSSDTQELSVRILGRKVPAQSATVRWEDGRTTNLPTIMKNGVNICQSVDAEVVKFFASFPMSRTSSKHIQHFSAAAMEREDIVEMIENALRMNKPVVVRGNATNSPTKVTTEWLDRKFGFNPDMPVSIHDVETRIADSSRPHQSGTISDVVSGMSDETKIQCVLDIPYVHGCLPDPLRNLDHGRRFGWSQTAQQCPIQEAIHPDNFTTHSWCLLHQAGFVSFAHHDADGVATYIRMESGGKFWVFFRLKSQKGGRAAYSSAMVKLVDYLNHKEEVRKLWDAEVVYLGPGDFVIQPPGQVHGAYTPIDAFASGASFVNLASMHHTERARYMDHRKGQFLTNQTHSYSYSLETLRRIAISVPHLSTRITLYRRPLLSLCLMVLKCQDYIAIDAAQRKIQPSETASLAEHICRVISNSLGIKNIGSLSTKLFREADDTLASDTVDREMLWRELEPFRVLDM
ncbi:hypothetical protein DEU56DRAFT_918163 [Suillus clintonianus]|uniref:uncharacterized protein n=1 Tax=Suillus clintonianus TaxID=1904413 RepID=UPI001B85E96F|nr:uncharacterized protein DEU56DRAFT_918163 [Suillus clintonianus]KAG2121478.1 hypothetical protein DEU56DRAFT_918163 [Suillus clintonianus]